MNHNLNYLFVYCTFVPAENSLNAQPSPMRKRWWQLNLAFFKLTKNNRRHKMNTKYLMISSSILMGLLGLSASFFPNEILSSVGLPSTILPTLLLQIIGALYLGFALMNWMAKTVLIGGIYSKPLCIGNFLHFMVAGLALLKATFNNLSLTYVVIAAIIYSIFAILFGVVLFSSPIKSKN